MRDAPAEERHDGVMRDEADADRARHFQHPLEIVHAQRDAHAEHDDRESPGDEIPAEPREPGWMNQRQRAAGQNPNRKKIGGRESARFMRAFSCTDFNKACILAAKAPIGLSYLLLPVTISSTSNSRRI